MTTEAPNNTNGSAHDPTTSAVHDVIRTMDGEGTGDASTAAEASADRNPAVPIQPPERLNVKLEERLIDLGIFNRKSMAQRRVLGCLGCKLGSQPEDTGIARSMDIAQCNGVNNSGVRRILAKLVDGQLLGVETNHDAYPGKKPHDHFRFTQRAVQSSFGRVLTAPSVCGLESEDGSRRFNGAAEDILLDEGVFEIRGGTARSVLGCLACRLQSGEDGIHLNALKRCFGVPKGHAQKVLTRMVDHDVLVTRNETGVPEGGHRVLYTPAATEIGRKITDVLEVPAKCGLEALRHEQ